MSNAIIRTIPMYAINPAPVSLRQHLEPIGIQDLTEAVVSLGDRITVRHIPSTHRYVLVMGEVLWTRAKAAGDTEIEAAVLNASTSSHTWRLVEEVARWIGNARAISPLEEGQLFRLLGDQGLSLADIGFACDRDVSYIESRMKILDLCPSGVAALSDGRLPFGVAWHMSHLALGRQDGFLNRWLANEFRNVYEAEAVARKLAAHEAEGRPTS
ncbi:hypothetical protein OV450_1388 [Actinobacteria bacterium OV450]|nr:hypothetical protein OV450_1388 [Actinobacteria bacterium OV450]